MIDDFDQLLDAFTDKGIIPVLTTLPPLPNHSRGDRQETLDGFNDYIKKCCSMFPIIDLNLCMLRSDGTVNMDLYQEKPRYINGSGRQFLLWNKLGRNRVDRMLKSNLGFTIVKEKNFIGRHL